MHLSKWRWLQFLAQISCSLYLTHVPILEATFFMVYKLFHRNTLIEALCLLLGIFACVGGCHYCVTTNRKTIYQN